MEQQNNTAITKFTQETANAVIKQITAFQETGQLVLPEGYHVGNAVKSAMLYLQTIKNKAGQDALQTCTKDSICNCLLQMATKGEYPMQHCYFIPTGATLSFWERYTGKLMRAKRDAGIKSVNAQVVYEGDTFVYSVDAEGNYQLVSHSTDLPNMSKPIVAAYAVVVFNDGSKHLEVMTMDMMRKAWNQGATKGQSGAHQNFTDQMAKRTVISRACKIALDSSWDMGQMSEADEDTMVAPSKAQEERDRAIADNSSHAAIDADAVTYEEIKTTSAEIQQPDNNQSQASDGPGF